MALPIAATLLKPTAGSAPFQFHGWTGFVHGLVAQIDEAHRPGQAGDVAQEVGSLAPDSSCTLHRFELTDAACKAFVVRAETLPSATPYRLTDAYGRNLLVRVKSASVTVTRCKGPPDTTTAQTTYCVTVTLICKRVPDGL